MSLTLAIPYCSDAGHTRLLARAVAEGAETGGALPALIDVERMGEAEWRTLDRSAAIAFGTPTFMGTVAAGFKTFMDATSDVWMQQPWRDKLAGGFTVGSSPSGDKSNTLVTLCTFAMQHGMVWVGQAEIGPPNDPANVGINTEGFCMGVGATSSRDKTVMIGPDQLETARRFGARLARAARRWGREDADVLD